MTSKIVFHDLTSQKWPYSWSPFTLRTTLCLNYLELPYEHHEISYPDIAKTLSSLGVKPEPEDADKDIKFTLPAISIANETIMGSSTIAEKLASLKPEYEKKLFPKGQKSREVLQKFEKEILAQVSKGMGGLPKHVIAFVPLFLDERGSEYFYATREPRLGKLETLRTEALEEEKEKGWKELVKEAVMPILDFYKEMDGDGKGIFAFGSNEPQASTKKREEYMGWLEENKKWLDTSESRISVAPAPTSEGLKSQSEIPAIMFLRHSMKAALVIAEDNPTMFQVGKHDNSNETDRSKSPRRAQAKGQPRSDREGLYNSMNTTQDRRRQALWTGSARISYSNSKC
ncbi:hypothetical protein KCU95_g1085, partial [Aureobasidium melanogenum]